MMQQESIKVLFPLVGDIEWHARSLIITNQRVLLTNVVTDKDLSGIATVAGVLAGVGATVAASLLGVFPGVGGVVGARIAQSMRKSKIYDAARQILMHRKQLIFEFSNPVPLPPKLKVKKSYLINELRKVEIYTPKGGDYTEITFIKSKWTWSYIVAQVPLVNPQDIHNVLLKYLPPQLIETKY